MIIYRDHNFAYLLIQIINNVMELGVPWLKSWYAIYSKKKVISQYCYSFGVLLPFDRLPPRVRTRMRMLIRTLQLRMEIVRQFPRHTTILPEVFDATSLLVISS